MFVAGSTMLCNSTTSTRQKGNTPALSLVLADSNTIFFRVISDVPLQQSSIVVAGFGSVETLDFSMPSYDAATKGGPTAGSSSSNSKIPSFNPFGDFEPQILKSAPAPDAPPAPAAPAPAPAASAPAAAADSEAFEFKAPDISLPEFKAPSLPSFKAPSFKTPDLPDMKAPEMPTLDMPKLNFKAPEMPKFSMPSLPSSGDGSSSSFRLPSFGGGASDSVDDDDDVDEPSGAAKFTAPELPKISMPSVPEFKAPSFDGFKAPSFSMPQLPKLGGGGSDVDYDLDIPKFEAPKVSMPQVSMPSFPSFGGGDSSSSSSSFAGGAEEEAEPQEVRDERAREARQVYASFDSDAKAIEQQAREARNLANDKLKLANAAKDEACKTRPGGKWICLRNPFTAGY